MKISRDLMFSLIKDFGLQKERELIKTGEEHNAYQYRATRVDLLYVLCTGTIKDCKKTIDSMVEYHVDSFGHWIYDGLGFVSDENVRKELVELQSLIREIESAKRDELPKIMKNHRGY